MDEPIGKYEEHAVSTTIRGTARKACSCRSPFQDERYGKGIRLHNRTARGMSNTEWRCTVCGKER